MNEESSVSEEVAKTAEEIVSSGERITERISKLLLDALQQAEEGVSTYASAVRSVLTGALRDIERSVPEDQESTLRQVHDGICDAGAKAASSLELTLEEAKARSAAFRENELTRMTENLGVLEEELVRTMTSFSKQSTSELSQQLKNLVEHTSRTGSSMRPSIEAALRAAKNHPRELLQETAEAGTALTKSFASTLLRKAADMLESAAEKTADKSE
ncbi:hypothetical protein MRY87_11285 [bacterium]|nr:hypothetical protein [bacterium]